MGDVFCDQVQIQITLGLVGECVMHEFVGRLDDIGVRQSWIQK